MPELPEVETVRRGLEAELLGRRITGARVLRKESIEYPAAADFPQLVKGHTISKIGRRGKYLIFKLSPDNADMVVHLRMSGRLLILTKKNKNTSHARVELALDDGRFLVFDDTRVFGRFWFIDGKSDLQEIVSGLSTLGPEPLNGGVTVAHLQNAFRKKMQPIKSALLDQRIMAGIGNIYADESLHLAGIDPRRAARDINSEQLGRLICAIEKVLTGAIEAGGSSIRDYVNADGVNGEYQEQAHVYGREGQECRTCGTIIERIKLGGRSTFFCINCQKQARKKRSATRA